MEIWLVSIQNANFAHSISLMIKNYFFIWRQDTKNVIYAAKKNLNFTTILITILWKSTLIW